MSFYASNDRIYLTDSNNNISFDTNDSIPHILYTNTYNVNINFPDTTGGSEATGYDSCAYTNSVYVCYTDYQYVCDYDYFSGQSVCNWVPVQNCYWENQCQGYTFYDYYYNAKEWSQEIVLGDLPYSIDCDFILTKATGSRTSVGGINYYAQDLFSTINNGVTFSFQGSALVETAATPSGTKFLSRIISIYPNYTTKKLILQLKHSNNTLHAPENSDNYSSRRSIASSFSFSFNVYFGKFQ